MNTLYFAVGCIAVLWAGVKWLTGKAETVGQLETENDQLRAENELRKQIDAVDCSELSGDDLMGML